MYGPVNATKEEMEKFSKLSWVYTEIKFQGGCS